MTLDKSKLGRKSRNKGKAGEREVAKILRDHGFPGERTAQCRGKDGGEPDVIGMAGIHLEVKRTEALSLYTAMEQAIRDRQGGDIPVVVHRRNGKRWLAVMLLDDFLETVKEARKGNADKG